MPLLAPPNWTQAQLSEDAAEARGIFRQLRLDESLDEYRACFEAVQPVFDNLVRNLHTIMSGAMAPDDLAVYFRRPIDVSALRYVAAPPVSSDDLATMADVAVSSTLHRRPGDVEAVRTTLMQVVDPYRFPWIWDGREPTEEEIQVAVTASAAMVAASQVATGRRGVATSEQERAVKEVLRNAGFAEVAPRPIHHFADAPAPGEFCGESMLGETRADVIAVLHDRRILAVECKASNSAVNSFKRLIHEALGKARKWTNEFGPAHVIPAAVLSGVFSASNLATAQAGGLSLFWQFRLGDLDQFVRDARP